jgi:hypothetical protein
MIRETYADRHHHPPLLESAEIVVSIVLMATCWFGWYVARERYHLTSRQLAELATYLIVAVCSWRLHDAPGEKENGLIHHSPSLANATSKSSKKLGNGIQLFSAMTFTVSPGIGPTGYVSCKGSCWG